MFVALSVYRSVFTNYEKTRSLSSVLPCRKVEIVMIKLLCRFILLSFVLLFSVSCASTVTKATHDAETFTSGHDSPIHYVEVGEGPPVILIPGLFGLHSNWDRMIPFMNDKHRLLAIDNFGTGESDQPDEDFAYSVAEQADMIVAMMDELKITSSNLVGVSYGGMIALNIAARYPERVVSVVCIEGAVIMPKNTPYRRLIQGLKYPILGDVIIGFVRSGLFDETMAKDIMGPSWADLGLAEKTEIIEIVSKNANAASRRTWLSLARALNDAEDFSEEAKAIKAPVLYLSGDKSEFRAMTDRNVAYFKKNLPDIQRISFADGVHDLELQKPQEVAEMVIDFIEKNSSRPLLSATETETSSLPTSF